MKLVLKSLAVILASAILCAVIWACWVWKRIEDWQAAYLRVQRGDSQVQVVAVCGQPGRVIVGLRTNVWWEDSTSVYQTNGISVQEFHYYQPFSVWGEEWEIGFDAESNVVSKYHYISP